MKLELLKNLGVKRTDKKKTWPKNDAGNLVVVKPFLP